MTNKNSLPTERVELQFKFNLILTLPLSELDKRFQLTKISRGRGKNEAKIDVNQMTFTVQQNVAIMTTKKIQIIFTFALSFYIFIGTFHNRASNLAKVETAAGSEGTANLYFDALLWTGTLLPFTNRL